jgi:filamentous hemagglutinin
LNAQLSAQEVANGHAFDKHVLGQGNSSGTNEFANVGVTTRVEFQNFVENIVNTATDVRVDALGKKYFVDHNSRTIVIINKRGESTAFRPDFDIGFEKYLKRIPKVK